MIITMSVIPHDFNCLMMISSIGVPFTGTIAFGMVSVSGCSRVPFPAAKITACMRVVKVLCLKGLWTSGRRIY